MVIERGERQCPDPPAGAVEHARNAAWAGVSPGDLNRSYVAARTVFNSFLRRESRQVEGYEHEALSRVQESIDVVFERLSSRVMEELEQEVEKKRRSPATQKLERVEALLAGELIAAPDLGYEFDATHIGIVGSGEGLDTHIKGVANSLGMRLLLVQPSPQKVWAWIGTRSDASSANLQQLLRQDGGPAHVISLGEPTSGLIGWRHTHREAKAALAVAICLEQPVVRYAEVFFIAAILSDDLSRASLERMYLAPLARERDGGLALRRTLRAYFAAGRNGKSAASALSVTPQTVTNHLRRVERRLGQPLQACGMELEAALRIADGLE